MGIFHNHEFYDLVIINGYFLLVFFLAYKAKKFLNYYKSSFVVKEIEVHYLAAKSITYWECLFSVCAASISAYHFLVLPGLVYAKNMSYLQFCLGLVISRWISAKYILPHLHNKGLTIIESIAKGDSYFKISRVSRIGRKFLSLLYFCFKVLDVGLKLYLGSILLSGFFSISIITAMMSMALVTYLYTILGGLKAVVRTDMLQFSLFIIAGIIVPFVIAEQSQMGIFQLISIGIQGGKFSILNQGELSIFILGVFAGILHDICATSCDQEIAQKFLGTNRLSVAKRALKNSSWITMLVNILFLSIGAILWAYTSTKGIVLNHDGQGAFYTYILEYIPTPLKGLLIAGSMAAVMSSLDSAINALSCTYWNDIMPSKAGKYLGLYIKMDMMIITLIILFVACIISKYPILTHLTDSVSSWAFAPLLALIVGRAGILPFYRIEFNLPVVFTSYAASFFGMIIAKVYYKANLDLVILVSAICSFSALKIYTLFSKNLDQKFSQDEGNTQT